MITMVWICTRYAEYL